MKEMITNVDYFKALSEESIEEISYYCEQVFFEKDTVIFRAGDPIDRIYFVINGKVNVTIDINDIDVSIENLYQGCSIGCNGVLGDFRYSFTARTQTSTNMYCITKDSLQTLINSCEDLDREIYRLKKFYQNSPMPHVDFR